MPAGSLYVKQMPLGPMRNFVYLIGSSQSPEVLVVDPAWDVPQICRGLEEDEKRPVGVFLTHSHADHLNGLDELLGLFDVPVYAHPDEIAFSGALRPYSPALRPTVSGQALSIGGVDFSCLHTPGHTPGSHCLFGQGALVTGDTLFVNACGRCDLEGGDAHQLFDSLYERIGRLPGSTQILPGHDYGDVPISTLEREKRHNPYYQFADASAFVHFRQKPRRPVP